MRSNHTDFCAVHTLTVKDVTSHLKKTNNIHNFDVKDTPWSSRSDVSVVDGIIYATYCFVLCAKEFEQKRSMRDTKIIFDINVLHMASDKTVRCSLAGERSHTRSIWSGSEQELHIII